MVEERIVEPRSAGVRDQLVGDELTGFFSGLSRGTKASEVRIAISLDMLEITNASQFSVLLLVERLPSWNKHVVGIVRIYSSMSRAQLGALSLQGIRILSLVRLPALPHPFSPCIAISQDRRHQ